MDLSTDGCRSTAIFGWNCHRQGVYHLASLRDDTLLGFEIQQLALYRQKFSVVSYVHSFCFKISNKLRQNKT